jgi:maltose O-acetyltransferase
MLGFVSRLISRIIENMQERREAQWRRDLVNRGMHIGRQVNLPFSTEIDIHHCFLISIGDNCGFGPECSILAHDAMSNEYIRATKIGKVTIHPSCHFGTRTIILPGVEIGPRVIVGSGSVVADDIPPDSVAVGSPAKVVCNLQEYLGKVIERTKSAPLFDYREYAAEYPGPEKRQEILKTMTGSTGYIIGDDFKGELLSDRTDWKQTARHD